MSTITVNPSEDLIDVAKSAKYVALLPVIQSGNSMEVNPADDLLSAITYIFQRPVLYILGAAEVNPAEDLIAAQDIDRYVNDLPVVHDDKIVLVDTIAVSDPAATPDPVFYSQIVRSIDFTATPRTGNRPLVTEFVAKVPPYANIVGWDFGNGQTADAVSSIEVTYKEAGEYEVTLTAEIYGVNYTGVKKFYIIVRARENLPDVHDQFVKGTTFEKTFSIPPNP